MNGTNAIQLANKFYLYLYDQQSLGHEVHCFCGVKVAMREWPKVEAHKGGCWFAASAAEIRKLLTESTPQQQA